MIRIDPEQLERASEQDILKYLLKKHSPLRIEKLNDYYIGKHDILRRKMDDSTKPNNKIVNNLAAFITDTMTGYFMGRPVVYTSDDEGYVEILQDIFNDNNEQDHNSEIAKVQGITGEGYELLYVDENAKVKFIDLPAENVIYVETDEVAPKPIMAVYKFQTDDISDDGKALRYYTLYTDSEIITYKEEGGHEKSYTEVERATHYFGEVPVVAYPNNKERQGDYEGVISLIDAYNLAQSDTANDFEYFTDSYLKMTGVRLDGEQVKLMKEQRVINLPDKECSADWLIKQINDVALENYKNRVRKDIHALSKTPNLSDESFSGNLTGVAIAYKIWGMDQIVSVKERKFKKGLQRRIRLITNILKFFGASYDWREVEIVFSRNMPQNMHEMAQTITQLRGLVSDETLLAWLPLVEEPTRELERLELQRDTIDLDLVGVGDDRAEDETT